MAQELEDKLVNVFTQIGLDMKSALSGGVNLTKEYASFYLGTGGLTGQGNTERTLILNSTSVNSNTSIFILSSNQVTINKTGNFKFSADCYFNNSSTNRTEYTFWLERNNIEVPGTRAGIYQRGYDSGSTSSFSQIIPVTSGDIFQLRINRTDGSGTAGYQDNNGTRLTIEEK